MVYFLIDILRYVWISLELRMEKVRLHAVSLYLTSYIYIIYIYTYFY